MFGFKPGGDCPQFGLSAVDRLIGPDAADYSEVPTGPVSHFARVACERNPDVAVARKLEVRRHDSNHCRPAVGGVERLTDHRRVAAKSPHPKPVTQYHGPGRVELSVLGGEHPAKQRLDAEGLKEIE